MTTGTLVVHCSSIVGRASLDALTFRGAGGVSPLLLNSLSALLSHEPCLGVSCHSKRFANRPDTHGQRLAALIDTDCSNQARSPDGIRLTQGNFSEKNLTLPSLVPNVEGSERLRSASKSSLRRVCPCLRLLRFFPASPEFTSNRDGVPGPFWHPAIYYLLSAYTVC